MRPLMVGFCLKHPRNASHDKHWHYGGYKRKGNDDGYQENEDNGRLFFNHYTRSEERYYDKKYNGNGAGSNYNTRPAAPCSPTQPFEQSLSVLTQQFK